MPIVNDLGCAFAILCSLGDGNIFCSLVCSYAKVVLLGLFFFNHAQQRLIALIMCLFLDYQFKRKLIDEYVPQFWKELSNLVFNF